jgi:hypothetical protein
MINQISLIEEFRLKVLNLIEKHPEYKNEINNSCTAIFVNGVPSFTFSCDLDSIDIKNEINSIFNNVFK